MSTARRYMASLKPLVSDKIFFHMLIFLLFFIDTQNTLLSPSFPSLLFYSVVSVGFEYESCPDLILWEKRTAVLQGYETTASKLGGWTVDKHHALNIQSGESTCYSF